MAEVQVSRRSTRAERGGRSSTANMKRLFEILLPVQPFTGLLSAVTIRFQAHPEPLDNDRNFPVGVWREVWGGNSSPKRRQYLGGGSGGSRLVGGLFYNRGSLYSILYQAVEEKLGQALASAVCQQFLIRATRNDRGKFKRVRAAFEAGDVWSRPGLYAGYLAVKCTVFVAVCTVSHPFSILRTVVLMRGDVPLLNPPADGGFWVNLKYATPYNPSGLYWSSLGAHVLSTLAEVCLMDMSLRTLRHTFRDYLDRQQQATSRHHRNEDGYHLTHADKLRAKLNFASAISMLRVVSSFAVNTLLMPLLTVRLRLEGQGGSDDDPLKGPLLHSGLVACARTIWRTEGVAGFYRGLGAHVLIFAGNALWVGLIYGLTDAYIRLDIEEDEDATQ